jgi:polyisoprenoid-binding protein YceI
VTAQVTLLGHGEDPRGNMRVGYEAKFTIKRSEFGINYMPGGIGDEVHIVVAVEGVKK